MKNFIREFKKFALRSNVMDLAIAVVIGGAINTLVKSIVDGIFNPFIDLFTGKTAVSRFGPTLIASFSGLAQAIISFFTITLCVFFMLKAINNLHRLPLINRVGDKNKEEDEEEVPPTTEQLLTEIRDLLVAQQALSRSDGALGEIRNAPQKSDVPDRLD
jgi:large conductance mechanosensitive channel